MGPIEEIGLLKMDFLGLRNLDVIEAALDIIEQSIGERPDMATLPLDDPKTYEMLARGDSVGVFQFESDGMRDALRKVKPTEFEDLVALVALYRPGAMRHIDTYARNKRNPDAIHYPDERLRPITESTYSVILYQEQSMQIAKEIAGFSGPEADDLRKAIGKKERDEMASLQDRFIEGARASGTTEAVIQELWEVNEAAADYSFNRSHAACYALIAYRTAWLKANYPAEYMAALISSVMSTKDKVPFFVSRCEEMGIEVLPPDVNESGHDFVVGGQHPLRARRGEERRPRWTPSSRRARRAARSPRSGTSASGSTARREQEGDRVAGAVRRARLHRATRRGMLEVLPQAQAAGKKVQQDAQLGQGSIFDLEEPAAAGAAPPQPHPPVPPLPDERKELQRDGEGDARAVPLLAPAQGGAAGAAGQGGLLARRARGKKDGEWVTVGGMIAECKRIRTKKGDPMMFATLDDLEAQVEILVFNSAYAANADKIDVDAWCWCAAAWTTRRRARPSSWCRRWRCSSPRRGGGAGPRGGGGGAGVRRLTLHVPPVAASFLDALKEVVGHYPGDHELLLERRRAEPPAGRAVAHAGRRNCRAQLAAASRAARIPARRCLDARCRPNSSRRPP